MKAILRHDSRDFKSPHFGALVDIPLEVDFDAHLTNDVEPPDGIDCTARSTSDVCVDQAKVVYDHDELWSRINHENNGADPRDVLTEVTVHGIEVKNNRELDYRWRSYARADLGISDKFDNVRASMTLANSSAQCNTYWYREWFVGPNGVLPKGQYATSGHSYKLSGWKVINGQPHFIVKAWQGYVLYMPRDVFNDALSSYGTSCFIPYTIEGESTRKKTILETIKDILINIIVLLKQKRLLYGDVPNLKLYNVAKGLIGQHLTLDPTVPNEVGCAEAVSYVLKTAGVPVPPQGIPGTASLLKWLQNNPLFQERAGYEIGNIILCATGTGNGKIPGHVGVCAKYGILSNDSQSGLFLELWDIEKWIRYYQNYGGMQIHYFALK